MAYHRIDEKLRHDVPHVISVHLIKFLLKLARPGQARSIPFISGDPYDTAATSSVKTPSPPFEVFADRGFILLMGVLDEFAHGFFI